MRRGFYQRDVLAFHDTTYFEAVHPVSDAVVIVPNRLSFLGLLVYEEARPGCLELTVF